MKKFIAVLMLCAASFCSVNAGEINWGEKLAFYLPNRLLDALDTFSVNLGVGPVAQARLMVTRYCDIGAGISASTYKAYKDYNRQYGAAVTEGWYWSCIFVGEEDYRAFILYSTLFRRKWTIPAYIIAPIILSVLFAFDGGQFYSGNLCLSLIVLYAALALIVFMRCRRWVLKIKKKTPQVLHLMDTTIIFMTRSIIHLKNEKHSKIGYHHLVGLGESKMHFILYFDSGKSMIFRKEDMKEEVFAEFKTFIESKVHKKSYTNMIKR